MGPHNSMKSVKEYAYAAVMFALGMQTIPNDGTFAPAAGTGAFGN